MKRQTIALGAGILAGLAAAALSAAMSGGMAFLFMLSPLPLMLAALGFLLESPGFTGQLLCIDGGQHLAWRTPDVLGVE